MSEESRREAPDRQGDGPDQPEPQTDQQTKEHVMTDQTTPIVEDDGLAGAPSTTGATGAADPAGAEGPAGPARTTTQPDAVRTAAEPGAVRATPEPGAARTTMEPAAPAGPAERRGPSVPTIVWGLLFGLVAAVVIVGQTSEVDLNLEVSAPLALLAAGVVLVVWGVAGLGRSRRTP